ncbi:SagB/ThcOx family dehydrogenase [Ensifer sp. NPDC090286]|uniref:SagB/ThcOx family dehydrogenase n=1 Tax=Ensifer sp. NPDC090286 TaxID=3363991 RepID=UPI00383A1571
MQLRINPLLLIYPSSIDGRRNFIIETSASRSPLIQRSPDVAWALTVLPEHFTAENAVECWADVIGADAAVDLLDGLIVERVIVPENDGDPSIQRYDEWMSFGWGEAASFHEATRDYPFVKMNDPGAFDIDRRRMQSYVDSSPPPSIYQHFDASLSIELPPRLDAGASANEALDRMSLEDRRAIPGLGLFFDICYGQRSTEPFDVQGSFLRKTIPSGGARHPTEIFFTAFENSPLPPGSYHYNVEHHRLDCIRPGDHRSALRRATFDLFQKFDRPPFGLITFTSLVERAMWRYRDARSSRAVLIDIGHALMIYRTVATAIGFETYTYQKIRDSELCETIGIDRIRQPPLFVGTLV